MKIIEAPASKSYSHRYLLSAAMSFGKTIIHNILYAEDIEATLGCLELLGVSYKKCGNNSIEICGINSIINTCKEKPFYVGNSATLSRILPFILSTRKGEFSIHSGEQLSQRSHEEIISFLKIMNADIYFLSKENVPPFYINAHGAEGKSIRIEALSSSQYISGLLMAAPLIKNGFSLVINPRKIASFPYVIMTLATLSAFSIPYILKNEENKKIISLDDIWHMQKKGMYSEYISIHIQESIFSGGEFSVPSDWSNMSYLIAIALLGKEAITIKGSSLKSYQGDSDFIEIVRKMGGKVEEKEESIIVYPSELRAIDIDMRNYPDIVPTLAVLFAFAKGKGKIFSIETLRNKETDRISAIKNVLTTVGVNVEEGADYLIIEGTQSLKEGMKLSTYSDHRIAMICGILKAIGIAVEIENMSCVDKSYPTFWQDIGIKNI